MHTFSRRIGQCLIAVAGLGLLTAQAGAETRLTAKAFANLAVARTVQDGKLYSGEVAVFDSAGKITEVILGSQGGSGFAGDPLTLANLPASLTLSAAIPDLKGPVGRLGTLTLEQAIIDVIGSGFSLIGSGQTSSGVLPLDINGVAINVLPVGNFTIDTGKTNGGSVTANGQYQVVSRGIVMTFVATVPDIRRFAADLAGVAQNATIELRADGVIVGRLNGTTYVVQPSLMAEVGVPGQHGFSTGADGLLRYQDIDGDRHTLHPAFADLATLRGTMAAEYPGLNITANNGTFTAVLDGRSYALTPDYILSPVPSGMVGKSWWSGADGKFYVRNADGSAQGFTVK